MANVKVSRRERAERTRAKIIQTAYRLLVEKGWDSTTMQLVADEAGFAVQTVYFVFGTKSQLVASVEEYAIAGGSSRAELGEWGSLVAREDDPQFLICSFVETDTRVKSRLAPLIAALGGAIPAELAPARDRESGRDRFFGSLVDRLAELGALRPGLSRERALDRIRALNALETYTDLTRRRGWTDREWIDWMSELLVAQLTRPAAKP